VTAVKIDTVGIESPEPILKIASASPALKEVTILGVIEDCPTFEADICQYRESVKKTLLWIKDEDDFESAVICGSEQLGR
jgi:TusA-related sulfurtransferase